MNKTGQYKQELRSRYAAYAAGGSPQELEAYIRANSNLPGPRGNLGLAGAFANIIAEAGGSGPLRAWELFAGWSEISAGDAPVNNPREFLPFCAALGFGVLGARDPQLFPQAIERLRNLARDPRWRTREAVAMGLQSMLAARSRETIPALEAWVQAGDCLEIRAVVAGVAEPALLKDPGIAEAALRLHQATLDRVLHNRERKSEPFRVLRQALGYSLSWLSAPRRRPAGPCCVTWPNRHTRMPAGSCGRT